MGGSIASFDFAFGDTDVYVIAEMPDEITAAAVATAVAASGAGEHRDRRAALGRRHRRRDRQARALPPARRLIRVSARLGSRSPASEPASGSSTQSSGGTSGRMPRNDGARIFRVLFVISR